MEKLFAGIFVVLSAVSGTEQEYNPPAINILNMTESAKVQVIEHKSGDRYFLILPTFQGEEETINWDSDLSEQWWSKQRLLKDSNSPVTNFLSVTSEADFQVVIQRNGNYTLLVMPTHTDALASLCEKELEELVHHIRSITPQSVEALLPVIREHCYQ